MVAIVLLASFILSACGGTNGSNSTNNSGSAADPSDTTIVFGFTPWTTTFVGTYVVKQLIEENFGYNVKLQDADVGVVYQGLGKGSIDVFMDNWRYLHEDRVAAQGGNIEYLGMIFDNAVTGWAVPEYVDENLQSIADLNDYRDLFNGELICIDPGSSMSMISQELIEEYGLDYTMVAPSEAAMLTALKKAYNAGEPILFCAYTTHSMFFEYELRMLDDPKGIWEPDEIHVVAHVGLKDKAPEVYEMLKRFEMPLEDYQEWIYRQDNGEKPEDLAREWIDNHPEEVKYFLGQS